MTAVVGLDEHRAAVGRLERSYGAIGVDAPVRLAKRTTNLFRARSATDAPGLDVSGLGGVISIDVEARTADVQGMCTYEDLVEVTLAHGLIPYVVPQLRTITLGGAVTGLGIEATSFRNGLPHESVLELDVFTGSGDVVTARPEGAHADLFETFPNSYGTLGYATRIRITLEQVPAYARLRHIRFDDIGSLAKAVDAIASDRDGGHASWDGIRVDAVDGVAFTPQEAYLTLAEFTDAHADTTQVSDYTGQQVYYRSIRERGTDVLSMNDYLWRWDTDWFWCSGAFGAQNRWARRVWPRRYRRSDFYQRLIGLDNRFHLAAKLDAIKRNGIVRRERVIQDIEVPVDRLHEFVDWFDEHVQMRPIWLCPLRLREPDGPGSARVWPLYPLRPGTTYVNVGFWGTVPIADGVREGEVNRAIEATVSALGGHKSLYSDAYYDEETFDELYNGAALAEVKGRYDPRGRLTGLYEKAVKRR